MKENLNIITVDNLIEKGIMNRTAVFGVKELSEIYKLILTFDNKKTFKLDFLMMLKSKTNNKLDMALIYNPYN
ncbi:MAG: hypothetical protein R2790_06750 [Flavobacterium haoranii]